MLSKNLRSIFCVHAGWQYSLIEHTANLCRKAWEKCQELIIRRKDWQQRPSEIFVMVQKRRLCLLADLERTSGESCVTVSQYVTTGGVIVRGAPFMKSSWRSFKQISRCNSPHPAIICSPASVVSHFMFRKRLKIDVRYRRCPRNTRAGKCEDLDHRIRFRKFLQAFDKFGQITWVLNCYSYSDHRGDSELYGALERGWSEASTIQNVVDSGTPSCSWYSTPYQDSWLSHFSG